MKKEPGLLALSSENYIKAYMQTKQEVLKRSNVAHLPLKSTELQITNY
jgi:hypothetical protein